MHFGSLRHAKSPLEFQRRNLSGRQTRFTQGLESRVLVARTPAVPGWTGCWIWHRRICWAGIRHLLEVAGFVATHGASCQKFRNLPLLNVRDLSGLIFHLACRQNVVDLFRREVLQIRNRGRLLAVVACPTILLENRRRRPKAGPGCRVLGLWSLYEQCCEQ